ncbi:hydrolase [uncultured Friedmanniella sp.]|uniref:hydrolase n=1 Tax=uncultured Friedmanniella sp. TaxID=335381 RepID=UPI0035C98D97
MTVWSCRTCAVEHADTPEPPERCAICSDDRQYVLPAGQRWTTLAELRADGRRGHLEEVEPGLTGVTVEPQVGIGQRGLLVRTPAGTLLWDPVGYVDDDLEAEVRALGGLAAIASSHPHMFGAQVAWSHRFGGVPVWVAGADREWVQREDPVVRAYEDEVEVLPGVRLVRIGGHFAGSAVAHLTGADGRGVLLSGDTVAGTPDEHWVSFLRSYPNKVPLSAAVVEVVARRVLALDFDRLYDNVGGCVRADAASWVRRSAERYTAWVRGDYDHLTGTVGEVPGRAVGAARGRLEP